MKNGIGSLAILSAFLILSFRPLSVIASTESPIEKPIKKISKDLYKKITDKNAVLVMSFQNLGGETTHFGDYLSEQIRVALANMPKIVVLDRKAIDTLLSERKLAESGLIDEKSAINFGKSLGAKTVIFGILTDLEKNIGLTIKVVDIEKGILSGGGDYVIKKTGEVSSFLKNFPDIEKIKRTPERTHLATMTLK